MSSTALWLRSQLRNIAPFATLLVLVALFSVASPSFPTLDNLYNILQQISVTGIIAVGLTFVILCAEIDLSVASVANAVGIVVAYFTAQDASVNIANIPLPGFLAIVLALIAAVILGCATAFGMTVIGIPSFIMTLAMLQIGAGVCAMLVHALSEPAKRFYRNFGFVESPLQPMTLLMTLQTIFTNLAP